jgi:hypothetical protein
LELGRLRALEASHVGVSIDTRGVTPVTSGGAAKRDLARQLHIQRSPEPGAPPGPFGALWNPVAKSLYLGLLKLLDELPSHF